MVTLKGLDYFFHSLSCSMILSLCNCHLIYFLICSSFRPTVLTQYPLAQKCRPQYRFFNPGHLSKTLMALLPFKKPTISETEYFGGIDNIKWIWSIKTFNSSISNFFHLHNDDKLSSTVLLTPFSNTLYRYFGHQTKWYLHSQTTCAIFLKSLIEYLLLIFRVALLYLKEVFLLFKTISSLTYSQSIAGTIPKLRDGLWMIINNWNSHLLFYDACKYRITYNRYKIVVFELQIFY